MLLISSGLIYIIPPLLLPKIQAMNTSYTEEESAFLKQLGIRIRELRISQSVSQEKLAFICDLDRTYVGSVERGERNISVLNLKKLSASLNVSLAQFFGD